MQNQPTTKRNKIFISKATPGDNEFALWLAPRLEAEGYEVFADILKLWPGDGWRLKITNTLQDESVKMLLCCSDNTLQKEGVIEEIEIAKDLVRSLDDPRFIIPLKMKKFRKVFGIGGLQYIDFENGWADGLDGLLDFLEKENVPKTNTPQIQSNWAAYRRRKSVEIVNETETLTTNWLRILSVPDDINYVTSERVVSKKMRQTIEKEMPFPIVPFGDGYLTFAGSTDFGEALSGSSLFEINSTIPFVRFVEEGWSELSIDTRESKGNVMNLFRQAWEMHCRKMGFLQHFFSKGTTFVVDENKIDIGKRVSWGRQGKRRNSMLRNIAKGKVWEYGVSAQPNLFPFPHFRLKGRVLFSEADGRKKANVIDDPKAQHRLRRSVCSGWRNKAWHGRLMAFMELLAGESPYVSLNVGIGKFVFLDGMPIQATAPVTARQTNYLDEDAEEQDATTIGGHFSEEEA